MNGARTMAAAGEVLNDCSCAPSEDLHRQQLEDAHRTNHMLESELRLTLAAMKKAEESHASEVAKLEALSSQAVQDARAMLDKLQALQNTEDAVREFYVQLKERCFSFETFFSPLS